MGRRIPALAAPAPMPAGLDRLLNGFPEAPASSSERVTTKMKTARWCLIADGQMTSRQVSTSRPSPFATFHVPEGYRREVTASRSCHGEVRGTGSKNEHGYTRKGKETIVFSFSPLAPLLSF